MNAESEAPLEAGGSDFRVSSPPLEGAGAVTGWAGGEEGGGGGSPGEHCCLWEGTVSTGRVAPDLVTLARDIVALGEHLSSRRQQHRPRDTEV